MTSRCRDARCGAGLGAEAMLRAAALRFALCGERRRGGAGNRRSGLNNCISPWHERPAPLPARAMPAAPVYELRVLLGREAVGPAGASGAPFPPVSPRHVVPISWGRPHGLRAHILPRETGLSICQGNASRGEMRTEAGESPLATSPRGCPLGTAQPAPPRHLGHPSARCIGGWGGLGVCWQPPDVLGARAEAALWDALGGLSTGSH